MTRADRRETVGLPKRVDGGRVRSWLGLERNILVMTAVVLTVGMGEELWQRFVPKYLEMLGAGVFAVAAYGTLKDFLDGIYQYPGGWVADRLGRRAALILFALLAAVGYALYLFAPSWEWVLVGTLFVMAWSSLTSPAVFTIIGDNLPPARRAIGFGVQSILKRVPPVVATPLGGWLIAALGLVAGVRLGLGVTIVLALASVWIVRRGYVMAAPLAPDSMRLGQLWRGMDPGLKRLLVADCLARWAEGVPKVLVVLDVLDVLQLLPLDFGWLVAIQRLTSILVYVPLARLSDRMNRTPFVLLTFALVALFPLVLANAAGFAGAALAFLVAGLWETGEPARKALIMDLAAPTARGRAVGLYYLVRGLAVFPAPLLGGWLWTVDVRWPFYAAFLIGVAGLLVYALVGPGGHQRDSAHSGERPSGGQS